MKLKENLFIEQYIQYVEKMEEAMKKTIIALIIDMR